MILYVKTTLKLCVKTVLGMLTPVVCYKGFYKGGKKVRFQNCRKHSFCVFSEECVMIGFKDFPRLYFFPIIFSYGSLYSMSLLSEKKET